MSSLSFGENRAQQHAGSMELRLGGARGDAEQRGDFLVAVAFDVVQQEHRARAVGKPGDGGLEIRVQLGTAGMG